MDPDLLGDLVGYQRHPDRAVVNAARSLLRLFRELHPGALQRKKDRGRPLSGHRARNDPGEETVTNGADDKPRQYGESVVATGVRGASWLAEFELGGGGERHKGGEERLTAVETLRWDQDLSSASSSHVAADGPGGGSNGGLAARVVHFTAIGKPTDAPKTVNVRKRASNIPAAIGVSSDSVVPGQEGAGVGDQPWVRNSNQPWWTGLMPVPQQARAKRGRQLELLSGSGTNAGSGSEYRFPPSKQRRLESPGGFITVIAPLAESEVVARAEAAHQGTRSSKAAAGLTPGVPLDAGAAASEQPDAVAAAVTDVKSAVASVLRGFADRLAGAWWAPRSNTTAPKPLLAVNSGSRCRLPRPQASAATSTSLQKGAAVGSGAPVAAVKTRAPGDTVVQGQAAGVGVARRLESSRLMTDEDFENIRQMEQEAGTADDRGESRHGRLRGESLLGPSRRPRATKAERKLQKGIKKAERRKRRKGEERTAGLRDVEKRRKQPLALRRMRDTELRRRRQSEKRVNPRVEKKQFRGHFRKVRRG